MNRPTLIIDGARFETLKEFYEEVSRELIPGSDWGHNLDAFNDILRGGFGTPEAGFILRWQNSARSRACLGYDETIRVLDDRLTRCDPSNAPETVKRIEAARRHQGTTIFDDLVSIIKAHEPPDNSEKGIELRLE